MDAGSFHDLVDSIAAAVAGRMMTPGRGGAGQPCGHGARPTAPDGSSRERGSPSQGEPVSLARPRGGGAACPPASYQALARISRNVIEASSHVSVVAIA